MSEDALDPHPYPILLAEEINNMFTKIKHSYFVADIYLEPRQRRSYLLVFFSLMRNGFDAFLRQKIKQSPNLQIFKLGVATENA